MNTELQENILDAVSVVANRAAAASNTDKTIECEICRIQNAATGIYTVQYTENKFTAYSTNGVSYAIGDSVYVLIPQGDFSKNKIILGMTDAAVLRSENQDKDYYNEISDNLLNDVADVELCTYNTETKNIDFTDEFISAIIPNYQHFVLKADFRTNIVETAQRVNGNYGLKISIPALDAETSEAITIDRIIDIYNMDGNIYNLEDFATQELYFDFDGTTYDSSRNIVLSAFVKNFRQDPSITDADIFIKNIEFKAVEILTDEDLQGYFLTVDATEGYYFLNGRYEQDKVLTPKLKIDGVYADVRDYECYWFKEDSSIDIDNEKYNARGGRGWRILNPRIEAEVNDDGSIIYDYNTSIYTQLVQETDIVAAARYKCVLLNSNITLNKIITISNLNNDITFTLNTPSGLTSFVKNVGVVTLNAELHYPGLTDDNTIDYIFQRFDKNGNYLDDNFYTRVKWDEAVGQNRLTQITYPVSAIEEFNTIKCEFVRKTVENGEVIIHSIGTASILLAIGTELYDYYISTQNGDVLYKYDANGNSPLVANYDGPYQSKITKIDPLSIKVFRANGDELSTSEYSALEVTWAFPKRSMLQLVDYVLSDLEQDDNYYYISDKNLVSINYDIKDVFNNTYNDNTILITAKFDGSEIQNKINISFLKDGEAGTNGSQYAAVVTYNGLGYEEKDSNGVPQKIRIAYVVNAWKRYNGDRFVDFGEPQFDVKVYKNGARVDRGQYNVSWSMFDSTHNNATFKMDSSTNTLIPDKNWTDPNTYPINIIQATITIRESSDTTTGDEILYAYYPLDVIRLSDNQLFVPDITGGFWNVLFESDGTNPKYNTNDLFKINIIDGLEYYDCDQSDGWKVSSGLNLSGSPSPYDPHKYVPVSQYIDGESKNYVAVTLTQTNAQKSEIDNEYTKAKQKETEIRNKIQYYINEKEYLLSFLSKYDYDRYVNDRLTTCENYLTYRARYITKLNSLKSILDNIHDVDPSLDYTVEKSKINIILNGIYNATSAADIISYTNTLSAEGISDYTIIGLINNFNETVADGIRAYNNLVNYNNFTTEINLYNNIVNDIQNLPDEMVDLVSAHDSGSVNQEFVNIQTQIQTYGEYFNNIDKGYTKNWIIQNILKPIEDLLSVYRDRDYINEKYRDINAGLEKELDAAVKTVTAARDKSKFTSAIVIKPILFTLNRYGLACLNGWDGNKLYTGNNDEYILAPQMGAGKKEGDLFTGIVMGVKGAGNSTSDIGLFGYNKGEQSIFLDAHSGKAIFGKAGEGQIKMVPNDTSSIAGWQINASSLTKKIGTASVGLYSSTGGSNGNMAFEAKNNDKRCYITYDGGLYANNAYIDGEIYSKKGKIGGWYINSSELYSGDFCIDSDGYISYNKDSVSDNSTGFYLGYDGINVGNSSSYLKFSSNRLTVRGNIEADTGYIGAFEIFSDGLHGQGVAILGQGSILCGSLSARDGVEADEISAYDIYIKNYSGAKYPCATQNWVDTYYPKYVWVNNQISALQSWVQSQGYVTSSALSGYATEWWVRNNFASYSDLEDLRSWVEDNFKRKSD